MARNKKKIIRACTVSLSIDFFDEIMRRMRGDGYEMVALTSPGPELDKLKEEGFHCIEVEMERHISPVKDLVSLIKLVCVLWKEKPYMIHSMTPKAGLLCMMAGWLTGVPVRVHTFTGLVWPTAVGLKRRILMATDWLTCACATHVIPEGQGVLNDLKNGGITKKPLKVLGYGNVMGVDMERFDPKRFVSDVDNKTIKTPEGSASICVSENSNSFDPSATQTAADSCTVNSKPSGKKQEKQISDIRPFTFIFVGRIVGDKGINELVEAFTKLHEKYENTKLVLVGKYEENLDPVKPVTLDRIKANPAIEACGPKYGDDLLKEYVKADCHILPSYREGFPNTPMEAGAMGLPNIVTDINGAREIVVNLNANLNLNGGGGCVRICDNGIIVPPKDAKALYEAMERMVTDDAMREKMKKNARPMIEARFEMSFVRKCLYDFYDEIMGKQ